MANKVVWLGSKGLARARTSPSLQQAARTSVYRSSLVEAAYAERMTKRIIALKARIVSVRDVLDLARQYRVCERYVPWVIVEFKRTTGMELL
jgi:hypothetical protein